MPLALVALPMLAMAWALFSAAGKMGVLDWDMYAFLRWIVPHSLKQGEWPWWHAWYCGGYPAWGLGEGDGNLVSPLLPFYLLLPMDLALRAEVLVMSGLAAWGGWLLARRYLKDPWLAAVAVTVGVLNGRWVIQVASGHLWHLQFAFCIWAFYALDRALTETRGKQAWRWAVLSSVFAALMVYGGGIYPTPQFALLAALAGGVSWYRDRNKKGALRPLWIVLVTGCLAIGLSAPKLFAVADAMTTNSRVIPSREHFWPHQFVVMAAWPFQRLLSKPISVPDYGWWEYGIYVGPIGLGLLILGLRRSAWLRKQAGLARLQDLGLVFLLLGFGNFPYLSPWYYLHWLPVFKSMHVPSRFHYMAVVLLVLVGLAAYERWLSEPKHRWARKWTPPLALLATLAVIGTNHRIWKETFVYESPAKIPASSEILHSQRPTVKYVNQKDESFRYLSVLANVDVLSPENITDFAAKKAVPNDSEAYRGEVHVVDGAGLPAPKTSVELLARTPNSLRVRVRDAPASGWVVVNANADPSWRVGGHPAQSWNGLLAAPLASESEVVFEFVYRPRTLALSLAVFVVSLLVAGALAGALCLSAGSSVRAG